MSVFVKPHLDYDDQLALMIQRGIACPDRAKALRLLANVGYYRLGAYVYPFRVLLPEGERGKVSRVHYRANEVMAGTTLDDVEALRQFDSKLRLLSLDALASIEVAIRARLAYVIAEVDRFGHIDRSFLDATACSHTRHGEDLDEFDRWADRYNKLQRDARNEDYVIHHLEAYGDPMPIWIAAEFLDFGALTRLLRLTRPEYQTRIASGFGIKGGGTFTAWAVQLNYLRNVAAHSSRTWNRVLTYKAGKFKTHQVGDELRHAADLPSRDKVYVPLAIMAYLTKQIDPVSRWHLHVREALKKFPDVEHLSPEQDMGFPEGWRDLPLWSRVP